MKRYRPVAEMLPGRDDDASAALRGNGVDLALYGTRRRANNRQSRNRGKQNRRNVHFMASFTKPPRIASETSSVRSCTSNLKRRCFMCTFTLS